VGKMTFSCSEFLMKTLIDLDH